VNALRPLILIAGLLVLWQALVSLTAVPHYILPGPWPVAVAIATHLPVLAGHLGTTLAEILLGLVLGTVLGSSAALAMILSPLLKRWMLPVLVVSQAIMNARPLKVLTGVIIPSALPAFASGLRVATAVAPIGAVVGEWVGSSRGLGFYMLHANARMQIDLMFAALTLLAAASLTLYFLVDRMLDRLVFWQPGEGTP
jgi:putative hydroxymethylpyrimidine transport system permease protein